jgi:hypothetical protein
MQVVCVGVRAPQPNIVDTLICQVPKMLSDSRIDVEFEYDHERNAQDLEQSSVQKRACNACGLTADARWTQSSHQKGLPPTQRDVKRIATATIGIMPVTYTVILMSFVYESCGRLQRSACARRISARRSVAFKISAAIYVPNVSSNVHFSSKHGCRIVVEFLELHWHSRSRRPQPMRGNFSAIHSSYPC